MTDWGDVWQNLLNDQRLGEEGVREPLAYRTAFDTDYDRIIFSSAFRRLQDKTQVFPLSRSDYTRTRLTHSLEVASVGRSLGKMAVEGLGERRKLGEKRVNPDAVGTLVSAACLAHDVGNPPFGHSGETSIQEWAKQKDLKKLGFTKEESLDFEHFEGNAQTFRAYARLQGRERRGGLRLTYATLGALIKYPVSSGTMRERNGGEASTRHKAYKKFGYFQDDKELAEEVFRKLCLDKRDDGSYQRHPLAYLMEAADDICYAVIDLEDAHRLKVIPSKDVYDLLCEIAAPKTTKNLSESGKIIVARATAINELAKACSEVFVEAFGSIVEGTFDASLIEYTPFKERYKKLTGLARKKVYTDERVLQIEYAGFQAIGGLLDMLFEALEVNQRVPQTARGKKLLALFPTDYLNLSASFQDSLNDNSLYLESLTPYQRMLVATDYISGMTDGFAVDLFQKLSGIKLPT